MIWTRWRMRFPFRLNFWLMLVLLSCLVWGQKYFGQVLDDAPHSDFYVLIQLILKMALYFVLAVLGIATCSVLIPFLLFQFGKRARFKRILYTTPDQIGFIQGNIPFYMKPFLGKLQVTIWYKDADIPPDFISRLKTGYVKIAIPAQHIRVYQVKELDTIFVDFMGMYRLPASLHSIDGFSKHPELQPDQLISISPLQFKEEDAPARQLIHHPGEWLQYKPFESGDDVRRILWKLYAKSRELMVRQQEMYTSYSSKIHITAVFDIDEHLATSIPPIGLQHLLDVYKNEIYTLYKQAVDSGAVVSFAINGGELTHSLEGVKQSITAASWHIHAPLQEISTHSFVVFHSLIPVQMVEVLEVLKYRKTPMAAISLIAALPKNVKKNWLWKWLFKEDINSERYLAQILPSRLQLEHLQEREHSIMQQFMEQ